MCDHSEWIKICVLCGDVLEDSEIKSVTETAAEANETVYISI
jgi:hypothetical protein